MSDFKTHMTKAALLLAGASLLSTAAFAKPGPKADLDQDGQVTKAEFMTATTTRFVTADLNGDGMLSQDEVKAGRAAMNDARASERFNRADANGDGVITRAEQDALREQRDAKRAEKRAEMQTRIDTNGDGTISDAERATAKAERKAKRDERKAERGAKTGERGMRGKRPVRDANGDGFITRVEYEAAAEAMFTRMDANGDGVLTKGEGRKRKGRKGKRRGSK